MAEFLPYTTVPGDRWDLIAWKHYGEANRTAELIAANRDLFLPALGAVPLIFDRPVTIRVPLLPQWTIGADSLPPWKR